MKTTILLIDDRKDAGKAIREKLKEPAFHEYHIIGELRNRVGLNTYFSKPESLPNIVLLDKKIDGDFMEGVKIAKQIYEMAPASRIILTTEFSNRYEFAEIHSLGIFSGYLKKESFLINRKIQRVLEDALDDTPYWDVPRSWLKYRLEDNIEKQKREFLKTLKKSKDKLENLEDHDADFQWFLRDEKLRTQKGMTRAEWDIFKQLATGSTKKDTIKKTKYKGFDTLLNKVRKKLELGDNKNNAMLLIKALEMQVPDIVEIINAKAKCRITYPS